MLSLLWKNYCLGNLWESYLPLVEDFWRISIRVWSDSVIIVTNSFWIRQFQPFPWLVLISPAHVMHRYRKGNTFLLLRVSWINNYLRILGTPRACDWDYDIHLHWVLGIFLSFQKLTTFTSMAWIYQNIMVHEKYPPTPACSLFQAPLFCQGEWPQVRPDTTVCPTHYTINTLLTAKCIMNTSWYTLHT